MMAERLDNEDYAYLPAHTVAELIAAGELSAVEYVRILLDRIQSSRLNAFCTVSAAPALAEAAAADREVRQGNVDRRARPLLGVPVSIKDNIETAGTRTTYGSAVFAGNIPDADAVCVERLRRAGAVIIGKTTLPEFASKGVVDSPLLGVTRNPWNLGKVVGGSSGGAAAAVAAGLGPLAIGNDQAGSVRIPGALCGVPALKPTGGRVPFVPNRFPWDQMFTVGVIAREVKDLDLALGVLEGPDSRDPLSLPEINEGDAVIVASEVRAAWSASLGFGRVDDGVLGVTKGAVATLSELFRFADCDIDMRPAREAYTALVPAKRVMEIGDTLDGWERLMDPAVVAYVRRGESLSTSAVRSAWRARTRSCHEVERILGESDIIVTPTLSVTAFDIGADRPGQIAGQPLADFHEWFPFTYPFNMTGHPAVTIPIGFADGLPVGLQFVGRRFSDHWLMQVARAAEARLGGRILRPPVH